VIGSRACSEGFGAAVIGSRARSEGFGGAVIGSRACSEGFGACSEDFGGAVITSRIAVVGFGAAVIGSRACSEAEPKGLAPLLRQLEYFEKAVLARYNLISDEFDVFDCPAPTQSHPNLI
jgi:hypothetical protein